MSTIAPPHAVPQQLKLAPGDLAASIPAAVMVARTQGDPALRRSPFWAAGLSLIGSLMGAGEVPFRQYRAGEKTFDEAVKDGTQHLAAHAAPTAVAAFLGTCIGDRFGRVLGVPVAVGTSVVANRVAHQVMEELKKKPDCADGFCTPPALASEPPLPPTVKPAEVSFVG